MEQEREILGIRGEPDANLIQVNVSLPKTRFDEILESQDFEGILNLIAEIRKEKIRRSENKWKNSDMIQT